VDSRYNPYDTNLSASDLSINYNDGGGNLAGVSYRFGRNDYEYLEGRMTVSLVKPFVFNFASRYSIDGGKLLESLYSLEYKHQCWSVVFAYGDRPGNTQFYVNFVIAGIGSLGKTRVF
jgi:LPS-assembly protein